MLRDGIEWLANHGTLEGSFFVERPFYKVFSGKKLSAALKVHDHLISVENIQSSVEAHGSLNGRRICSSSTRKAGCHASLV